MRRLTILVFAAATVLLLGLGLRPEPAQAYAENDALARKKAVATAVKVVKDARKKPSGDAETLEAIAEARAALDPWADSIRKAYWGGKAKDRDAAFGKVWNEILTVASFHGKKVKARYILAKTPIIWKRYLVGLPVGGKWMTSYTGSGEVSSQLNMFIRQERPGGVLLREIKIWTYSWNTVYSGVGGENSKKLAKVMHEVDRDSVARKGRKASKGVKARRLNKEMKRVYYYFVEGLNVGAEAHLRRQSFYFKGEHAYTYCFEVITHLDPVKNDDRVTTWQTEADRREFDAVMASLVPNPDYVRK